MEAAGIDEMEFVAKRPKDDRRSDICNLMDGKRLPVPAASGFLKRFHALSAEDQEAALTVMTPEDLAAELEASVENLVGKKGYGFPPATLTR